MEVHLLISSELSDPKPVSWVEYADIDTAPDYAVFVVPVRPSTPHFLN